VKNIRFFFCGFQFGLCLLVLQQYSLEASGTAAFMRRPQGFQTSAAPSLPRGRVTPPRQAGVFAADINIPQSPTGAMRPLAAFLPVDANLPGPYSPKSPVSPKPSQLSPRSPVFDADVPDSFGEVGMHGLVVEKRGASVVYDRRTEAPFIKNFDPSGKFSVAVEGSDGKVRHLSPKAQIALRKFRAKQHLANKLQEVTKERVAVGVPRDPRIRDLAEAGIIPGTTAGERQARNDARWGAYEGSFVNNVRNEFGIELTPQEAAKFLQKHAERFPILVIDADWSTTIPTSPLPVESPGMTPEPLSPVTPLERPGRGLAVETRPMPGAGGPLLSRARDARPERPGLLRPVQEVRLEPRPRSAGEYEMREGSRLRPAEEPEIRLGSRPRLADEREAREGSRPRFGEGLEDRGDVRLRAAGDREDRGDVRLRAAGEPDARFSPQEGEVRPRSAPGRLGWERRQPVREEPLRRTEPRDVGYFPEGDVAARGAPSLPEWDRPQPVREEPRRRIDSW